MAERNPYASPALDDSTQGMQWTQSDPQGLAYTQRGLLIVYIGIVVLLISIIASVVLIPLGGSPHLLTAGMGATVIGFLLTIVGRLFCLSVPSETGAKGLIIASVVAQLLNALWYTSVGFVMDAGIPMLAFQAVRLISGFLSVVLFILFMRKLSHYIARYDLRIRASNVLFAAGLTLVFAVLSGVLAPIARPVLSAMLGIGIFIAGLSTFVMYANLVDALRKGLKPKSHTEK